MEACKIHNIITLKAIIEYISKSEERSKHRINNTPQLDRCMH